MTEDLIRQNAEFRYKQASNADDKIDAYISGAHSRDAEIRELEKKVSALETVIITARATISTQEAIIKGLRNPWISVEDRLPKNGDVVFTRSLIIVEGGGKRSEEVQYLTQKYTGKWITNSMKQHRMGGIMYDMIDKVTHWMPIPQIEKGE